MSLESEIKKLTEAVITLNQTISQQPKQEVQQELAKQPAKVVEPASVQSAIADIFGVEEAKPEIPAPSINDVKVTLKAFMDKNGEQKTVALLKKFNAGKLTEVKEEDYAKLIAAAAA